MTCSIDIFLNRSFGSYRKHSLSPTCQSHVIVTFAKCCFIFFAIVLSLLTSPRGRHRLLYASHVCDTSCYLIDPPSRNWPPPVTNPVQPQPRPEAARSHGGPYCRVDNVSKRALILINSNFLPHLSRELCQGPQLRE